MATATRLLLAAAVLVVLAVILTPTPATSAGVPCADLVPSDCTPAVFQNIQKEFAQSGNRQRKVRQRIHDLRQKCCESLVNNVEDRCFCEVASIVKMNAFKGLDVPAPDSPFLFY
jgi:Spy/CpxP family protein refolding chaperone